MTAKTNFWWTAATASVVQAVVFYLAYQSGITSRVMPYDECDFVLQDLENAQRLKSVGLLPALPELHFAHQPITNLQVTASLLLSGNHVATPYPFNVVYVFLFLYMISRTLRPFGPVPIVAFWLMAISVPLVFLFSSHLKTDYLAGCFFFAMLVELFLLKKQRGQLARACFLACCVVVSKPTAFYVPGLVCLTFAGHFARQAGTGRVDRTWSKRLPAYIVVCAAPVVTYAALVLPNFDYFVAYIKQALSPPWVADVPLEYQLRYYLPLSNGDAPGWFGFWGAGFTAFILLGAAFALTAVRRSIPWDDALTLVALLVVSFAAYVPLVISPQIQMAFGAVFAGSVLALFLAMYAVLKRCMARSNLLDWALIAVSLACFSLPVRQYQLIMPSSPNDIREASALLERFVGDMAQAATPKEPRIYFNYSPIPYSNFLVRFYLATGRFPAYADMPLSDDAGEIRSGVQASDYVIVYDPGGPLIAGHGYWGSQGHWGAMIYLTRDLILDASNLRELDRMPFAGGSYVLYRLEKQV